MEHILGSIGDYLEKKNTDYAYLLDGGWGSGKTFFLKTQVNEFLKKKNYSLIYISLNGLKTVEEVNKSIFFSTSKLFNIESLKNFENSKYGKLMKGLSKLSMDLGMSYAGINQTKIFYEEFTSINSDVVLCFDDLERSQLKIDELMGIIGSYLENDNAKVILIANEEELIKNVEHQKNHFIIQRNDVLEEGANKVVLNNEAINRYIQIKEKTVGRTMHFSPTPEYVLQIILDKFDNEKSFYEFLYNKKSKLLSFLNNIKQVNMRVLIQSINDLKKIFDALGQDNKIVDLDKIMLAEKLFDSTLIFSIELRLGNILSSRLRSLSNGQIVLMLSKDEDIKRIMNKYYSDVDNKFSISFYNLNSITNYIISGNLALIEFEREIKEMIELIKENTLRKNVNKDPLFILEDFYELEDDYFKELFIESIERIKEGTYKIKDYLKAFNLFEYLNKEEIISESIEELFEFFKSGIDKITIGEEYLNDIHLNLKSYSTNDNDISDKMHELAEYVNIKISEEINRIDSAKVTELVNDLNSNFENTIKKLFIVNKNLNHVFLFFQNIGDKNFVDILQSQSNKNIGYFTSCIYNAYHIPENVNMQNHTKILIDIKEYLEECILNQTDDYPIKKRCLKECKKAIDSKIDEIKNKNINVVLAL